jgi:hypothetical protein
MVDTTGREKDKNLSWLGTRVKHTMSWLCTGATHNVGDNGTFNIVDYLQIFQSMLRLPSQ